MNTKIYIISEIKDFEESHKLITTTFNHDLSFPEQVFSNIFNGFVFEEFDWAISAEFWRTIQQLAIASHDSFILTAVLDPCPIDYFYREFGYYNWFKLPLNLSADDYWNVLQLGPEGSPADAMLYNSNKVVWISSSMKWAVWGERSLGICVLAFRCGSDLIKEHPPIGRWRSVDQALVELLPINFYPKQVPKDFSDILRQNYLKAR